MGETHYGNAMTEVALALAMAFFSIMILAMVSMGAAHNKAASDDRQKADTSIAAKLAANLLTQAGATRIVMLDIHSLQTIGYFDIPGDHIYGETVILDCLTSKDFSPKDLVVGSPDVGACRGRERSRRSSATRPWRSSTSAARDITRRR